MSIHVGTTFFNLHPTHLLTSHSWVKPRIVTPNFNQTKFILNKTIWLLSLFGSVVFRNYDSLISIYDLILTIKN